MKHVNKLSFLGFGDTKFNGFSANGCHVRVA